MGKQVAAGSNGGLAQLGEHLPCKQGVESSNLSVSTDREIAVKSSKELQNKYLENFIQREKDRRKEIFKYQDIRG